MSSRVEIKFIDDQSDGFWVPRSHKILIKMIGWAHFPRMKMVKNNCIVKITSMEFVSNRPSQCGQQSGFGRRNSMLRQDEHLYIVTYDCDTLFPMLMPIEAKRNSRGYSMIVWTVSSCWCFSTRITDLTEFLHCVHCIKCACHFNATYYWKTPFSIRRCQQKIQFAFIFVLKKSIFVYIFSINWDYCDTLQTFQMNHKQNCYIVWS